MIEIFKNKDNLKDYEITETVTRVKALIINSNNDILLGYSYFEYQFPGGHVESDENLNLALQRELKEETGLMFETKNLKPIAVKKSYYKDYPEIGNNRAIIIYYYEIKDDRIPDLSKTSYTEEEIDGKYTLRYVPLNIVCDVLKDNANVYGDTSGIASEMIELFSYYFK